MFDGPAVPKAHEMHVGLLKGTTGRRDALERTEVSTTHRYTACNGVPFGHQVLDREMQIGKGCPQHPDDLPRRVGASIVHTGGNLVIEKVRRDQVVYDGEVTLVEDLLKGTTILCLVFFFSCRHVFDSFSQLMKR